jgi:hypothetical protein
MNMTETSKCVYIEIVLPVEDGQLQETALLNN